MMRSLIALPAAGLPSVMLQAAATMAVVGMCSNHVVGAGVGAVGGPACVNRARRGLSLAA